MQKGAFATMLSKLSRSNKGFTIIEVLIVMAIAGLIMLIVFLAVPALQRNSRNTSFRQEASQLLSAVAEFASNKNGSLPAVSACTASGANACTVTPASNDAMRIFQLTKLKNITEIDIVAHAAGTRDPTFSRVWMVTGAKCGAQGGTGNSSNYTTLAGPGRAVALIYAVEASDGTELSQCQES